MCRKSLSITAMLITATALASWAQPQEFPSIGGTDEARPEGWNPGRAARMAEYLDLSESQTVEWQAILDRHNETAPDRDETFEDIGTWREEFRLLAGDDNPDLEQLGQLALNVHRAHESVRASRTQLISELQTVLTPEQAEKLEALQAAREFSGRRERKGTRHRRISPGSD